MAMNGIKHMFPFLDRINISVIGLNKYFGDGIEKYFNDWIE